MYLFFFQCILNNVGGNPLRLTFLEITESDKLWLLAPTWKLQWSAVRTLYIVLYETCIFDQLKMLCTVGRGEFVKINVCSLRTKFPKKYANSRKTKYTAVSREVSLEGVVAPKIPELLEATLANCKPPHKLIWNTSNLYFKC